MKNIHLMLTLFTTALLTNVSGLQATDHKTPGQHLDNAIDKSKDKFEHAKDKANEKIDHAKEKARDKLK